MTLFADFLGDLFLLFVFGCAGMGMLARWAFHSGAASTVAKAAGRGVARKAMEVIFKKH